MKISDQYRAFLKEAEPRIRLLTSIRDGRPPVEGLDSLIQARFGEFTYGQRRTFGKVVREQSEELGHPHQRFSVRIKGKQYQSGSTYSA
jgi:hypothetical protein